MQLSVGLDFRDGFSPSEKLQDSHAVCENGKCIDLVEKHNFLILIKSSLSVSMYFVVHASGIVTEKPLHNPVSQNFSIFF